jgi:hypothetical protein
MSAHQSTAAHPQLHSHPEHDPPCAQARGVCCYCSCRHCLLLMLLLPARTVSCKHSLPAGTVSCKRPHLLLHEVTLGCTPAPEASTCCCRCCCLLRPAHTAAATQGSGTATKVSQGAAAKGCCTCTSSGATTRQVVDCTSGGHRAYRASLAALLVGLYALVQQANPCNPARHSPICCLCIQIRALQSPRVGQTNLQPAAADAQRATNPCQALT